MRPHVGLVRIAAEAEGHRTHAGQPGEPVEDPSQRVLERGAVVHARAHHDLPVHLDPAVEEDLQPAQAGGTLGVAQHVGPQIGIGGVDGDEEGAQPFGQDALGVELGEPGERGEVPVQEGQPVIVVLQVQAAPHTLRQLVDETEGTVVVTRTDTVEHRRGDLHPERLAGGLLDAHRAGHRRPGAAHHDPGIRRVGESLEVDDVARLVPVNALEHVTHGQAGPGCRRRLGDRGHRRC